MTRKEFIAQYGPDVIKATNGSGLFPSVMMAQMIIESADKYGVPGNGITARKANNFFGIKADKSWTGPKMAFNTPNDPGTPVSYFRVYATPLDSMKDRVKFLQENSRYTKGGVFSAKTAEDQAWAIQRSGYAQGNDGHGGGYADTILKIVNGYDLKALDNEALKKKD